MQTSPPQILNVYTKPVLYRPDIDGLRAIAVLSVIFFHINPAWASGGFIGVDLFFVISGYLITSQIRQDIVNHTFTIKNFYLRRIRRIAPPLIAMLMCTCAMAWFFLEPEDIRSFAYSLIVQPLSLQNLVFLSEGDYFRGGNTKALLHTWSLAVEEQFYVFWPLLLVFLNRLSFKFLIGAVGLLILASFYLCTTLTLTEPQAAFFLIFTRTWELGLGGLVALWHEQYQPKNVDRNRLFDALGWLGIAALGWGIFFIDASMPFPGKVALVPVLATCVIVLFGGVSQSTFSKALSSPWLVKIGLISYPLYLWHWPLLVFMHQRHINPSDLIPLTGFWVTTFALAYTSYRWLETPIRRKQWLASPRGLAGAVLAGFSLITALGIHAVITDGAAYRFNEQPRAFLTARIQSYTKRCEVLARLADLRSPICRHREVATDKRKVLLWGNSHASMLIPMLTKLATEHEVSLYINTKNTRPLIELDASNQVVYNQILSKLKDKAITTVVLASSWQGIDNPAVARALTLTVAELSQQNIEVWLVIDPPGADALDPTTAYAQNPQNPKIGSVSLSHYNQTSRLMEVDLFQRLVETYPNVRMIDASPVFCDTQQCWGGKNSEVWYRDATHLNNAGAHAISSYFLPIFQH